MDGNKKGKFGIALLVIGALAGLAYFLVKITNHRKIVFSSTPVMDEYDFSDCDGLRGRRLRRVQRHHL